MLRRLAIPALAFQIFLCAAQGEETVSALPEEEVPPATGITRLHSVQDKKNKLEVRLLESDGSADVARNPVGLFLVVTDDAPGDTTQIHIWRLPEGVAQVKSVSPIANGVKIAALVDGQMDEASGRFPEERRTINLTYSFAAGALSDKIKVSYSKP